MVSMEPIRISQDLLDQSFENEEATIAACALPIPGNKPHKMLANNPEPTAFVISFFGMSSHLISCLGMFTLSFKLNNIVLVPNKPDNKGNKGFFIGRFSVKIPSIPASIKIINAQNF